MFLTETEAEVRLRDLHCERSRLDRAIADLVLFLDIGRHGSTDSSIAFPHAPETASSPHETIRSAADRMHAPLEDTGTDRSLARREGRQLMEAAADILTQAGRPLHAAEILEGLTSRGLTVPGLDPVAALNTRLWKRSGPDGPFQRLGDAVYALATGTGTDPEDE